MFIQNSYRFGGAVASLLLDTYTGAAAAYSLRKLKTGVTNVVRVRRSSDNTEQNFTPTEITDGTLTTFTGANDGFVATWYDQSGNSNDITQSAASRQLIIVSSGVLVTSFGSLPSMETNSSANGFLELPKSDFAFTHKTQATFSIVSDTTSTGTYLSGSMDATSTTLTRVGISIDRFGLAVGNASGTDRVIYHNTDVRGSYHILWDYNCTDVTASSRSNLRLNGSNQSTNTSTGTPSSSDSRDGLNVIGRRNGGSSVIEGKYQEIIIWDERKNTDRAGIESNINTYYSIY